MTCLVPAKRQKKTLYFQFMLGGHGIGYCENKQNILCEIFVFLITKNNLRKIKN